MPKLDQRLLVRLTDAAARGEDVEPVEVKLRDGSRAHLRPIRADDKDRLRRGLAELSPRSRLLRFHAPVDHLSEEQLRYLTEIDYSDHCAWVAISPDEPASPGMGVARYVRLAAEPTVAEAAVTVLDRYQGRGLATIMLAVLSRIALAEGITVFRNYVLADNESMLDLFDQLGATRTPIDYGVFQVDMPLARDADELPDTEVGRMLRAVASDRAKSFLGLAFPPVWFRRREYVLDLRAGEERDEDRPERGPLRTFLDQFFEGQGEAENEDENGDGPGNT